MSKVYVYRTTTDKIGAAYEAVESSGHSVEHCVFAGGRDFLLICRDAAHVIETDGQKQYVYVDRGTGPMQRRK